METVLFLTAGELRQMQNRVPSHFPPEEKLVIVASESRIKLLKPIDADGSAEPERGDVLNYLPRVSTV